MMSVILEILSYVEFELFEKNRQITNRWSVRRGLALNRIGVGGVRLTDLCRRHSWRGIAMPWRRRPGARRASGLLHDMGQLMGQELLSRARTRRILTGAKNNVATDRVRQRMQRARRLRGSRICMHAHIGKVMAETRREKFARRRIERLA